MPLSKEIAKQYRPAKGVPESFVHNIYGQVSLSKLTISQVERMEKQGLFQKIQKRGKKNKV